MKRIRQKLTSQSGASITYALLLFLVCAVVSSVVLAAGTAASGRMSQSVESDQRYYSVTSAAEFLKNQIDGKTVVLRKVNDSYVQGDVTISELLTEISKASLTVKENGSFPGLSCRLSVKSAPENSDTLVNISTSMTRFSETDTDPKMVMQLSNSNGTAGNRFVINLEFTASIESRTEKSGTEVKTVTWNFYKISTTESSQSANSTTLPTQPEDSTP